MSDAFIGMFSIEKPLGLRKLPNGGWVVYQPGHACEEAEELGAYSTAKEMLAALTAALIPYEIEP